MPKPDLSLHASWSFGDRRDGIEQLINELYGVIRAGDHDVGTVVAAMLFALIGGLREISEDNALSFEAGLVESSGLCLLHELDTMYQHISKKTPRKKTRAHVH
jgi:hypothetical protein